MCKLSDIPLSLPQEVCASLFSKRSKNLSEPVKKYFLFPITTESFWDGVESYTTKWEHSTICEKVASRRFSANALSKLFFLLRQLGVWINLFSIIFQLM